MQPQIFALDYRGKLMILVKDKVAGHHSHAVIEGGRGAEPEKMEAQFGS